MVVPPTLPKSRWGYADTVSFFLVMATITKLRLGHADFVGDRPNEPGKLASYGSRDGCDRFASSAELAILKAEALLRLPGDRPDRRGKLLLTQELFPADPCRKTIAPGRLDQHTPGRAVPRLGNAPCRRRFPLEFSDGTSPR